MEEGHLVDPIEIILSGVSGGGGILYFPYDHGLDSEVTCQKYIVTYYLDDEFPFLKARAYYISGKGSSRYIELHGYTKEWAVREVMKNKSVWVTETL